MECRNLLFVFCRLKRAGGVKQTAIRLETGEGVLKNSALKIRKDADLFGLEPPAGVHPAAQDAGIGAGDIEKDAVEVAPPFDPSGNTALVGATMMFEILCVVAESVASGRDGE